MKKFIVISAVATLLFVLFSKKDSQVSPERKIASIVTPKLAPIDLTIIDASREPVAAGNEDTGERKVLPNLTRSPERKRAISGTTHSLLPPGLLIQEDVHALKESDYDPSMGPILRKLGGLVFVKADNNLNKELGPVVMDKSGRYLIVKPVVKVAAVDQEKRQELIADGVVEHYYSEGLKLMYVESSPSTVLADAEKLEGQGHKISLEIQQGIHRLR